jgi:hypothetical protein
VVSKLSNKNETSIHHKFEREIRSEEENELGGVGCEKGKKRA